MPSSEEVFKIVLEESGDPCLAQRVVNRIFPRIDFSNLRRQLRVLVGGLKQTRFSSAALVYQQRLLENISTVEVHGDTESLRSARSKIVEQLDRLSREALEQRFQDL